MPGRSFTNTGALAYRYGFNGKENDNDVKGEGNQQDYSMRIYDPRVGKFLSVDPITKQYPELTPYQFASNTPIQAIDLDGLEALNIMIQMAQVILKYLFKQVISNGKVEVSGRAVTNDTFDFLITNNGELKIGTGHFNLQWGQFSSSSRTVKDIQGTSNNNK